MQEIADITEITETVTNEDNTARDIEAGLEIVASEMGNILEELKDNLEKLLWKNKEPKIFRNIDQLKDEKQSTISKIPKIIQCNKNVVQKINMSQNSDKKIKKCSIGSISITSNKKKDTSRKSLNILPRSTPKYKKRQQFPLFKYSPSGSRSSRDSSPLNGRRVPKIKTTFSSRCHDNNDQLKKLREQVETAIREKKTFTVCGNFYSLRRALLVRGWIEKVRILNNTYDRENLKRLLATPINHLLDGIHDPQNGYIYKRMIMTKLMENHQVDFYWDQNFDWIRICKDPKKLTLVNRFRRGILYTSKQGLCEAMKTAYWYQEPGVSSIRYPRTYNLSNTDDPKEFINDFKLTAAMSLLKWVVYNLEDAYCGRVIISNSGNVPARFFHFAVQELSKALQRLKHEDIDYEIQEALDQQWNDFLSNYYKIIHAGSHFKSTNKDNSRSFLQAARSTLQKIEPYWPYLRMDGVMNIWILKPANGCRGQGIYLCRTLQYILKIINMNTTRRYVVQKYIERPLLIYNTKFDIRQWFLISSSVPLTIWIYKDCYVRFSSQLYNLQKLHESVHLTNNSVQSKYRNCKRSSTLPACNMWDTRQFERYLSSIGYPNVFREVIYPGMKECLTGAILMNQCNLDRRKNCFEIYGSDFMITEDFKPWLIEINARPALFPSTPVTARMCPHVLEDLIKVVIDHARNPHAPTGRFELLYRGNIQKLPEIEPKALQLTGKQLPVSYFYSPDFCLDHQLTRSISSQANFEYTHRNIKDISHEMKKTLENLLYIVESECQRRKRLKHKSSQASNITELYTNKNILCIEDKPPSEVRKKHSDTYTSSFHLSTETEIRNTLPKITSKIKSKLSSKNTTKAATNTKSTAKATKCPKKDKMSAKAEFWSRPLDREIMNAIRNPEVVKSKKPPNVFAEILNSVKHNVSFLASKKHTQQL